MGDLSTRGFWGDFRVLGFSPCVFKVNSLEDMKLVPYLATRAFGGTVVVQMSTGGYRGYLRGCCLINHVFRVYSLEDIELVS